MAVDAVVLLLSLLFCIVLSSLLLLLILLWRWWWWWQLLLPPLLLMLLICLSVAVDADAVADVVLPLLLTVLWSQVVTTQSLGGTDRSRYSEFADS